MRYSSLSKLCEKIDNPEKSTKAEETVKVDKVESKMG